MTSFIQSLRNKFSALNQRPAPQALPEEVLAVSYVEGVHIQCEPQTVPADGAVPHKLRQLVQSCDDEIHPGQHYYQITVTFSDARPAENYYVAQSINSLKLLDCSYGLGVVFGRASTTFKGVSVAIPSDRKEPYLFFYFSRPNEHTSHSFPLSKVRAELRWSKMPT